MNFCLGSTSLKEFLSTRPTPVLVTERRFVAAYFLLQANAVGYSVIFRRGYCKYLFVGGPSY